jgi:hypothetical protein
MGPLDQKGVQFQVQWEAKVLQQALQGSFFLENLKRDKAQNA